MRTGERRESKGMGMHEARVIAKAIEDAGKMIADAIQETKKDKAEKNPPTILKK